MCVMIAWGQAADYFGRKPILVGSLAGITVATAAFGLSRTIWQMVFVRCAGGLFAGTVVWVHLYFFLEPNLIGTVPSEP
jgi:MFS family permease